MAVAEAEVIEAVAEAVVIEAAPLLEDMTGLPDDMLDTIATDVDEDDTAVPVAAFVEAGALTPLILRVTPALSHNCCANCTVAEKQHISVNSPAE